MNWMLFWYGHMLYLLVGIYAHGLKAIRAEYSGYDPT